MEITPSNFFRYYILKPGELHALKGVSSKEKLGLIVGAIALGVFSLGIVPLVCLALHNRSFKIESGEASQRLSEVGQKTLQTISKENNSKELPLTRYRELEKTLSDQELLEFDLNELNAGEIGKAEFAALFRTTKAEGEEEARGLKLLKQFDLRKGIIYHDLFSDEHKNAFGERHKENLEKANFNLILLLEDFHLIESRHDDETIVDLAKNLEEHISEETLDEAILKAEFKILFNTDSVDGQPPRGERLVQQLKREEVRALCRAFSKEHWGYLTTEQAKDLLSWESKKPSFKTAVEILLGPKDERAKKILNSMDANAIATLFPYLDPSVKELVDPSEKPILARNLEENRPSDQELPDFDFERVPRNEMNRVLQLLFSGENEEGKRRFGLLKAKQVQDLLPHLDARYTLWITDDQSCNIDYVGIKFLNMHKERIQLIFSGASGERRIPRMLNEGKSDQLLAIKPFLSTEVVARHFP